MGINHEITQEEMDRMIQDYKEGESTPFNYAWMDMAQVKAEFNAHPEATKLFIYKGAKDGNETPIIYGTDNNNVRVTKIFEKTWGCPPYCI